MYYHKTYAKSTDHLKISRQGYPHRRDAQKAAEDYIKARFHGKPPIDIVIDVFDVCAMYNINT